MSKQDGIGTWVWNSSIGSYSGTYNFNFVCNGISCSGVEFVNRFGLLKYSYIGISGLVYQFDPDSGGGWLNQSYRTIDIISAPPAEFMTILTANATYQEPVSDKYKLLDQNDNLLEINGMSKGIVVYGGKEYEFDNGGTPTDELLGTWEISIKPQIISDSLFKFKFTSGGMNWYMLETYLTDKSIFYTEDTDGPVALTFNVYSSNLWDEAKYRTITITDTSTLTNRDEFTTWLKTNAVKQ